ncbi:hypothetical protein ZWY2020_052025 [Hordeum vulgare]|nr:hypothetical protein ZWY2020_052025 [Hordeum vulgare]
MELVPVGAIVPRWGLSSHAPSRSRSSRALELCRAQAGARAYQGWSACASPPSRSSRMPLLHPSWACFAAESELPCVATAMLRGSGRGRRHGAVPAFSAVAVGAEAMEKDRHGCRLLKW